MPTTITKLSALANHARVLARHHARRHGLFLPGARRHARFRPRALPALWLVTDQDRLPDPVRAVARLPRGTGVILRHRDPVERTRLAGILAPLCRRRRLVLLIAGDPRLAARCGADGVHFPEARVSEARGWRRRRPRWLITAAAHDGPALLRAARAGVHGVLLSPVFPTASHPGARTLGPVRFAKLVRFARLAGAARGPGPLPVPVRIFALGGVTVHNARRLKSSGAAGLAGVGGVAG